MHYCFVRANPRCPAILKFRNANFSFSMKRFIFFPLIIAMMMVHQHAAGWIYPEHRYIAILAIEGLSPEHRNAIEKLWSEARGPYDSRLTKSIIDPSQGIAPEQLDYASWATISGDHSCSPHEMLNNVLYSNWIMDVADVAAQLKLDIQNAKNRSQHINALHNSDIRLQRADIDYATRAGSNNVHFLSTKIIFSKAELTESRCLNRLILLCSYKVALQGYFLSRIFYFQCVCRRRLAMSISAPS